MAAAAENNTNIRIYLAYTRAYDPHLPVTAHANDEGRFGGFMDTVTFSPPTLTVHDYEETPTDSRFSHVTGRGYLLREITATFTHDNHKIVFPIGTRVNIFKDNGIPKTISLGNDERGNPLLGSSNIIMGLIGRAAWRRRKDAVIAWKKKQEEIKAATEATDHNNNDATGGAGAGPTEHIGGRRHRRSQRRRRSTRRRRYSRRR